MTLSDYRQSQGWKGAVDLGPHLIDLAEALPAAEELGLSWQLRQLMVEIPATVAADLMYGTNTRRPPVFKLLAALELIDRVYPALDTADTRKQADRLADDILADNFTTPLVPLEQAPAESAPMAPVAPAPIAEPLQVPVLPDNGAAAPMVDVVPAGPQSVPIEPAPPVEPTHVSVQAAPAQENQQADVHANSVE